MDPILLSTPKLKPKNVTHYVNQDYSWKRQNGEIKRFLRIPKVTRLGQPKGFCYFGLNIGKLEFTGDFSLEKLVSYCL